MKPLQNCARPKGREVKVLSEPRVSESVMVDRVISLPMTVTVETALAEWMALLEVREVAPGKKDAYERRYKVLSHCEEQGGDPERLGLVTYEERLTEAEAVAMDKAGLTVLPKAGTAGKVMPGSWDDLARAAREPEPEVAKNGNLHKSRRSEFVKAAPVAEVLYSTAGLSTAEARAAVEAAKASGLVRGGEVAWEIPRDGLPAAEIAGVESQWMKVSPATARKWLENNFRNRPLSEDVVAAYARDMLNGTWVPTHQGVAFNDADELIDGQHRLHAIVRSGVTVSMMVTFGLHSKIDNSEMTTMDAVDRGRPRSVADQLKIQHGMKDGTIIASVCAGLVHLCYGQRTRRLSVGQTLEVFRAFEDGVHWVVTHRSKAAGLKQAGVLAGFAFALMGRRKAGAGIDEGPVAEMYGRMISEDDALAEFSGMGRLRAFLLSDEAKLLTRGTDRALSELVLEAIRMELDGTVCAALEMTTAGRDFFRALQPKRAEQIAAMMRIPEAEG